MNNIVAYIKKNLKNKEYVVSCMPIVKDNNLLEKNLKIIDIIQFSNYLNERIGLGNFNKKIGILLPNSNYFVNAFYSSIINEHIIVAINDHIEIEELNNIIEKNNLEYIISSDKFRQLLLKTQIKQVIYINEIDIPKQEKLNFDFHLPMMEDTLVISYTSGTSGNFSKGVILSCKNVSFVSEEYKNVYKLDATSQIITVLPLWHNYAMFACLTSSIVAYAKLIIMEEWNSDLFILINQKMKPTIFPGSPYMYIDLINNYGEKLHLMTNLKICDSGGDSLPIECINRFEKATGTIITEGYGLTETTSLTHFNYSAIERKVGSLGKCVRQVECKILDLDEQEVKDGEWGLLWIKGPMVFDGYVGMRPEDNKVKNKEGWFNTKDVVKRDTHGFYFIAGRYTDLESLNDEDGQLREVENLLYKFNGIKRIHIQSKYNKIADFYSFDIYAVLKEKYSMQDLYDYINQNLKRFVVNNVYNVENLPTTGTGKIKRNQLN